MVEYKITIVIKAEDEINNNELSDKHKEIVEALRAWTKLKEYHYPSLKLEILED